MATISKQMYTGAASTSTTTLYTVPAATTAVVTEIVVTNPTSAAYTFTINLNGNVFIPFTTIASNSNITFDIKQTLNATQTISANASNTSVNFFISGVEVS